MRAGFVQFTPDFGKPEDNFRRLRSLLDGGKDSAPVKSDLLVLPELCFTGYQFKDREELESLAEEVPSGRTIEMLKEFASMTGGHIAAGIPERCGNKIHNSSVLVNGDGLVAVYRKIHLFDREKEIFDRSEHGLVTAKVGEATVGLMICFDWIFPEVTRSYALMGVDIICHSANLVLPYCQSVMPGRAIENRIYIITSNREGEEARVINADGKMESLRFTGGSVIVEPGGKVIAMAGQGQPLVQIADIDPSKARNKQITGRNHLFDDRRPEFYRL